MIEVRLLGPVTVDSASYPVSVRRPLELALVARLAIDRGRMISDERLIDDLWAEPGPADPLASLQTLVYRLRRGLGLEASAVRREGKGYVLAVPPDHVDSSQFTALVAQARGRETVAGLEAKRSLLQEALGLWRGPPLAGLEAVPFVDAQRVRLEAARLTALEERLDLDLRSGAHREVVSELEGLSPSTRSKSGSGPSW